MRFNYNSKTEIKHERLFISRILCQVLWEAVMSQGPETLTTNYEELLPLIYGKAEASALLMLSIRDA
jgi:hypothetical protein